MVFVIDTDKCFVVAPQCLYEWRLFFYACACAPVERGVCLRWSTDTCGQYV